ncbi:uncharacterized protein LOC116192424 [Punica granatum]|nr:uncharacterized protein LOC116192424 [Punica granatum]
MGCFPGCFGKKRGKQRRRVHVQAGDQRAASVQPAQFVPVPVQDNAVEPVNLVSETSCKPEKEKSSPIARKRVTFDTNVQTIEHVEVPDSAAEVEEVGKEGENEESSMIRPLLSEYSSEDVSFASSVGSYTPNNRYENCRESDDEDLGSDCGDSDLEDDYEDDLDDDGDGDDFDCLDEDYDKIDRSRVNQGILDKSNGPVQNPDRLNLNALDRSAFVHPVLKPIENLTQWKAAKAKGHPPAKHRNRKEDLSFDQESRISFGTEPDFNGGSFS